MTGSIGLGGLEDLVVTSLRNRTIRLAFEDRDLRPHLLRLLVAYDRQDIEWALREVKRGTLSNDELQDVVDVLDARMGGEPAISDDFSDVREEIQKIRRHPRPEQYDLSRLQRALERALRTYARIEKRL